MGRTSPMKNSLGKIAAYAILVLAALALFWTPRQAALAQPDSGSLAAGIAETRAELDNNRAEIARIDEAIRTTELDLDRRRAELATATGELRAAEDRYDAVLRQYEGRVAAIYKYDQNYGLEALLSSESLSDAATTISYLDTISDNDRRLVERVKAEESEVRELREHIDSLKQNQNEDAETLKSRRYDLARQSAAADSRLQEDQRKLEEARTREAEEEIRQQEESAALDSLILPNLPGSGFPAEPPPGLTPSGIVLTGVASWYGPGFQGNHTANGEIYNMYGFTAAHKTLPFNTWVKVTAASGRSVLVRINDRGPYIGGRIIDLSKASAEAIGITGIGTVRVEIYR